MREKHDRAYYEEQLARSRGNLERLNTEGIGALSRYDIEIAAQGNAEQALKTAKYLVGNHIWYFESQLKLLGAVPEQAILFDAKDL